MYNTNSFSLKGQDDAGNCHHKAQTHTTSFTKYQLTREDWERTKSSTSF